MSTPNTASIARTILPYARSAPSIIEAVRDGDITAILAVAPPSLVGVVFSGFAPGGDLITIGSGCVYLVPSLSDGSNRWEGSPLEDALSPKEIEEALMENAQESAQEYADPRDDGYSTHVTYITARTTVYTSDSEEEVVVTHEQVIDPVAQGCTRDEHDWHGTYVMGNGGGVIFIEQCAHCGLEHTTDTWAQNPCTGQLYDADIESYDTSECSELPDGYTMTRVGIGYPQCRVWTVSDGADEIDGEWQARDDAVKAAWDNYYTNE